MPITNGSDPNAHSDIVAVPLTLLAQAQGDDSSFPPRVRTLPTAASRAQGGSHSSAVTTSIELAFSVVTAGGTLLLLGFFLTCVSHAVLRLGARARVIEHGLMGSRSERARPRRSDRQPVKTTTDEEDDLLMVQANARAKPKETAVQRAGFQAATFNF